VDKLIRIRTRRPGDPSLSPHDGSHDEEAMMADRHAEARSEAPRPLDPASIDAALHHTLLDYQATGMRWATWAAAAWAERMGAIGVESMDFAARRLREDAKAFQEIAQCQDAAERRRVQARFVQGATKQYAEEYSRLMGMGTALLEEIQRRVREGDPPAHAAGERHPRDVAGEDGTPENVAI
jgi:hypothetical protein